MFRGTILKKSVGCFIAVVKQQFVLGINCSIFLYRNWFGANWPGGPSELHRFHSEQFSRSNSRRMFCSNGFDTMHVVCTDLLCVVCIGLLSAKFSTVNTGLGRPTFWKPLCLLSTPGYHKLSTYINYLNFQPKIAHSVKH